MWVVRLGGDDGELRPWHYIYEGRRGRRGTPTMALHEVCGGALTVGRQRHNLHVVGRRLAQVALHRVQEDGLHRARALLDRGLRGHRLFCANKESLRKPVEPAYAPTVPPAVQIHGGARPGCAASRPGRWAASGTCTFRFQILFETMFCPKDTVGPAQISLHCVEEHGLHRG